jgi:hypothetical protein
VKDGDQLPLGNVVADVLHTPATRPSISVSWSPIARAPTSRGLC